MLEPPLELQPTVHVEDVPENEEEGDHTGPPLKGVPNVPQIGVLTDVTLPPRDDHEADDGMEDDRRKNERPFQKHDGGGPKRMD